MYPLSDRCSAAGVPCSIETDTPSDRADVYPTEAVMVTRSPTRMGCSSSIPSTEAVATGRRQ
jgi:hypothetical protein